MDALRCVGLNPTPVVLPQPRVLIGLHASRQGSPSTKARSISCAAVAPPQRKHSKPASVPLNRKLQQINQYYKSVWSLGHISLTAEVVAEDCRVTDNVESVAASFIGPQAVQAFVQTHRNADVNKLINIKEVNFSECSNIVVVHWAGRVLRKRVSQGQLQNAVEEVADATGMDRLTFNEEGRLRQIEINMQLK